MPQAFEEIRSAAEFRDLLESDKAHERERASHAPASIEVWMEAILQYPHLRAVLVSKATVPMEVLFALSADPDPVVRSAVARKKKLPSDLLLALSNDLDDGVRATVARNANAPISVIERLALDISWVVRDAARARLGSGPS